MPSQKPKNPVLPSNSPLIIKTVVITVVAVGFSLGMIYAGFMYGKKQTISKNSAVQKISPVAPTDTKSTTESETVRDVPYGDENQDTDEAYQKAMREYKDEGPYGWKEFTTKDGKYSLKYPPDWILTDKSEYVDLYNDGNKKFRQDITISKGDYSFKSYNPLAWGPGVCLYPDSPPFEGPGSGEIEKKYVEIKGINTLYRRPEQSTYPLSQGKLKWGICQKEKDSGFFTSVAGFGDAWYETPKQYDQVMFVVLDQILTSFTTIK